MITKNMSYQENTKPLEFTPANFTPANFTPANQNFTQDSQSENFTPANFTPVNQNFTPAQQTPANFTPANFTPANFTPANFTPANFTPANFTPVNENFTPVNFTLTQPTSIQPTSIEPILTQPAPLNFTPIQSKQTQPTQVESTPIESTPTQITIPKVPWQFIPDTIDDVIEGVAGLGAGLVGFVAGSVGEFHNENNRKKRLKEAVGDNFLNSVVNYNTDQYYNFLQFYDKKEKALDNIYKVSKNLVAYFGDNIYQNFDNIYNNPNHLNEINKISKEYAGHTFNKQQLKTMLSGYQKSFKIRDFYIEKDELTQKLVNLVTKSEPKEMNIEDQQFIADTYRKINENGINLAIENSYIYEFLEPVTRLGVLKVSQDVANRTAKKVNNVLSNLNYMEQSDAVLANEIKTYYKETIVPQIIEGMGVYQKNIHKGEKTALQITNQYFLNKYGYNFTDVDSYKSLIKLGQITNNAVLKNDIESLWYQNRLFKIKPISFNESVNMLQEQIELRRSIEEKNYLGTIWNYITKQSATAQQNISTAVWNVSYGIRTLYDVILDGGAKKPNEFLNQNNLSYMKNYTRLDQSKNYFFDNIKNVYDDNFDSIGSIIIIDALTTRGANLITKGLIASRIKNLSKNIKTRDKEKYSDLITGLNKGEGVVGQKIDVITGLPITTTVYKTDTGLLSKSSDLLVGGRLLTEKEYTTLMTYKKEIALIPIVNYISHVATQIAIVDAAAHNLIGGEYDPLVGLAFVGAIMARQMYKSKADIMNLQTQAERLASLRGQILLKGELSEEAYRIVYDKLSMHYNTIAGDNLDWFYVRGLKGGGGSVGDGLGGRGGLGGGLGGVGGGNIGQQIIKYDDLNDVQKKMWKSTVDVSLELYDNLIKKPEFNGSIIAKNSLYAAAKSFGEDPKQVEIDLDAMHKDVVDSFEADLPTIEQPKMSPVIVDTVVKMSVPEKDVDVEIMSDGLIPLNAVVVTKKNKRTGRRRVVVVDNDTYNQMTGGKGIKKEESVQVATLFDFVEQEIKSLPYMDNIKHKDIIDNINKKTQEILTQNSLLDKSLIKTDWSSFHPYTALKELQFVQEVSEEIVNKKITTKQEANAIVEAKKEIDITTMRGGGLTHNELLSIRNTIRQVPEFKNIEYEAVLGKAIFDFYRPVGIRVAQLKDLRLSDKRIFYYKPNHAIVALYGNGVTLAAKHRELKEAVAEFIANDYLFEKTSIWKDILPNQLGKNIDMDVDTLKDEILKKSLVQDDTQNMLDKALLGPFLTNNDDSSFADVMIEFFGNAEKIKINQFVLSKEDLKIITNEKNTIQTILLNDKFFNSLKKDLGDWDKYPESSTSLVSGTHKVLPIGYVKIEGAMSDDVVVLKPIYFGDHADLVINEQVRGVDRIFFLNDRNDVNNKITIDKDTGIVTVDSKLFFNSFKKGNSDKIIFSQYLGINKQEGGFITPDNLQKLLEKGGKDVVATLSSIEPLSGNHLVIDALIKYLDQKDKETTVYFSSRTLGQAHIFNMFVKGYSEQEMMNWLNDEIQRNALTYQSISYYYDYKSTIKKIKSYDTLLLSFYYWAKSKGIGGINMNVGTTNIMQIFLDVINYITYLGKNKEVVTNNDSIMFIKKYLPYVTTDTGKVVLSQEANDRLIKIFGLDKPNGLIKLIGPKQINELSYPSLVKIKEHVIKKQGTLGLQFFANLFDITKIPFLQGDDNLYEGLLDGTIQIHVINNPSKNIVIKDYYTYELPLHVKVNYYPGVKSIKKIIETLDPNKYHIFINDGYSSIEFKNGNSLYGSERIVFVNSRIGGGSELVYNKSLNTLSLKTNNKTLRDDYGHLGDFVQTTEIFKRKQKTIIPGLTKILINNNNEEEFASFVDEAIKEFNELNLIDKKLVLYNLHSYIGGAVDIEQIITNLEKHIIHGSYEEEDILNTALKSALYGDYSLLKQFFGGETSSVRHYVNETPALTLQKIFEDVGVYGGVSYISSMMLQKYIETGKGGEEIRDLLKRLVGMHFDEFKVWYEKVKYATYANKKQSDVLEDASFETALKYEYEDAEMFTSSVGEGGITDIDDIINYIMDEINANAISNPKVFDTIIYWFIKGFNDISIFLQGDNALIDSLKEYEDNIILKYVNKKSKTIDKNFKKRYDEDFEILKKTYLSDIASYVSEIAHYKENDIGHYAIIVNLNAIINGISEQLGYKFVDKTSLLEGNIDTNYKTNTFLQFMEKEFNKFKIDHYNELKRLIEMKDRNRFILLTVYHKGYIKLPIFKENEETKIIQPLFKTFAIEDLIIELDKIQFKLSEYYAAIVNKIQKFPPEITYELFINEKDRLEIARRPLDHKQAIVESILTEINEKIVGINNALLQISDPYIRSGKTQEYVGLQKTILSNVFDFNKKEITSISEYLKQASDIVDAFEDNEFSKIDFEDDEYDFIRKGFLQSQIRKAIIDGSIPDYEIFEKIEELLDIPSKEKDFIMENTKHYNTYKTMSALDPEEFLIRMVGTNIRENMRDFYVKVVNDYIQPLLYKFISKKTGNINVSKVKKFLKEQAKLYEEDKPTILDQISEQQEKFRFLQDPGEYKRRYIQNIPSRLPEATYAMSLLRNVDFFFDELKKIGINLIDESSEFKEYLEILRAKVLEKRGEFVDLEGFLKKKEITQFINQTISTLKSVETNASKALDNLFPDC